MCGEEEKCGCHDEGCECEAMTTDDIANHADDKVDALIQLLIKKNVISDEEYDKEFRSLFEEESSKEEKSE